MSSNNTKMEKVDEEDRLVAVIIAAGTLGDKFYPATQDCPLVSSTNLKDIYNILKIREFFNLTS